ncbi:MAG: PHP domain-containing protein [Thermodesulfobacteriota bacterium]
MPGVDLHLHSTCSDGTLTPAALVALAREEGLAAASVTDHDSVAGVAAALAAGQLLGVEVLSGVEIGSSQDGVPFHLLGYGFRPEDPGLQARLAQLQEGRQQRNLAIIERLAGLGIGIRLEELQAEAAGGQIGRPHFARLLQAKGHVRSAQEAFHRLLGRGRPAYASRFRFPAAEAIAFLQAAGGIAVLAHPGSIGLASFRRLERFVGKLAAAGLDGLEAYYPDHDPAMAGRLVRLATSCRLVVTGGSDFHGAARPQAAMGRVGGKTLVPEAVMGPIRERLTRRRRSG